MPLAIHAIDHIVIAVRNVEASVRWYQTVLGFEREDFDPGQGKPGRTSLKFGHQKINLRPFDADKIDWFTGQHAVPGSEDLCFLTTSTPDDVVQHFRDHGISVEEGPVAKQGARGALRSVYCRDPDGNLVEVASYDERPS